MPLGCTSDDNRNMVISILVQVYIIGGDGTQKGAAVIYQVFICFKLNKFGITLSFPVMNQLFSPPLVLSHEESIFLKNSLFQVIIFIK